MSVGYSDCSHHRAAVVDLPGGLTEGRPQPPPTDTAPGRVPFSIFTATVVYPARPFSRKAVALTTFPNSPSPRVFPRTKFFRGNSHFGSSYIGVETGAVSREEGKWGKKARPLNANSCPQQGQKAESWSLPEPHPPPHSSSNGNTMVRPERPEVSLQGTAWTHGLDSPGLHIPNNT